MHNTEIGLSLALFSCAAAPAFAQQDSAPQCAVTNFDQTRNAFTIINAEPNAINQQCFFTVMPKDQSTMGSVLPLLAEYPTPRLVEGQYIITLSGGGGGGGGGSKDGGGGGGAGALPVQVTQYLSPGIYRMTIGTGGPGGTGCQSPQAGGLGGDGNPSSVSEAYTGSLIAGFHRAEYWAGSSRLDTALAAAPSPTTGARAGAGASTREGAEQITVGVGDGYGAPAAGGQARGGNGGRISPIVAAKGQDGGMLAELAYPGLPGRGGDGFLPSGSKVALAGGGGGGAGYGHGGDGQPAVPNQAVTTAGELGGGGGGGAGGPNLCGPGGPGGHGFIAIRPA